MECDAQRQTDLDGRGTLSEEALAEFMRFFLETCIDQVTFMEGLVQPDRLRDRILIWTEEEIRAGARPGISGAVLEAGLYLGELPRAERIDCKSPKSLMRMLSDSGNSTASNLLQIVHLLQEQEGIDLQVHAESSLISN